MFRITIGDKTFTDERIFINTESNELIGENDLRCEFVSKKEDGEIDKSMKFENYLDDCLSENGFLKEVIIKDILTI